MKLDILVECAKEVEDDDDEEVVVKSKQINTHQRKQSFQNIQNFSV